MRALSTSNSMAEKRGGGATINERNWEGHNFSLYSFGDQACWDKYSRELRSRVGARPTAVARPPGALGATYFNHLNAKNPFTDTQFPEPGRVLFVNLSVTL